MFESGEWVDCLQCWKFPQPERRTQVTVLNKKYCRLYPDAKQKKFRKLEPELVKCPTLYTKCDFALEACAHDQILRLEDQFRSYETLQNREMQAQCKLADQLWVLSQRYLILTLRGICIKLYPEIVSAPTEERIKCEFHIKLKQLNNSNCWLRDSLENIREAMSLLERRCNQLDMTVESPFLLGNAVQRPLKYTRGLLDDLFKYFNGVLCKLESLAKMLDIGDENSIRDYMSLVELPSPDYQNFLMIGSPNCTCMRTRIRDRFQSLKTCSKQ